MLHPLYVVEIASMTELIDVLPSHRMGVFEIRNHRGCIIWGEKILACYETVTLFTQDNKPQKGRNMIPNFRKYLFIFAALLISACDQQSQVAEVSQEIEPLQAADTYGKQMGAVSFPVSCNDAGGPRLRTRLLGSGHDLSASPVARCHITGADGQSYGIDWDGGIHRR
jgi:hypothetical protein